MRVQRHLRDAQPPGRLPGAELELDGEAAGQYLRSLASTTRNHAGALKISLAIGLPPAAMPIAIVGPVRGRQPVVLRLAGRLRRDPAWQHRPRGQAGHGSAVSVDRNSLPGWPAG